VSGGSYNYLAHKAGDAGELARAMFAGELESMAARLDGLGPQGLLAARQTRDVARFLAAAETASLGLVDVWHAVEWQDSGDGHAGQVEEALDDYHPWPPGTEAPQ
jgi:hypothetical protein